jgi:hypothetical protein
MNQELYQLRLTFLENNFRNTEAARRAYQAFETLKDRPSELAHLLRYHKQEGIYREHEVYFRDDFDMLIGYYTVLAAGIFTGYLSVALDQKTIAELHEVLGHPAVIPYYTQYYPLTLPVYAYQIYASPVPPSYDFRERPDTDRLFEQFLVLLRNRVADPDIDLYLWLLDDGYVNDHEEHRILNLRTFLEFIGNPGAAAAFKQNHPESAKHFDSALAGFAKFIIYAEELQRLMNEIGENDLLAKSAVWHVESYWFVFLRTKMAGGLEAVLATIAANDPAQYLFKFDQSSSPEDIAEWFRESSHALVYAKEATIYLMDRSHGVPLQILMGDFDLGGAAASDLLVE